MSLTLPGHPHRNSWVEGTQFEAPRVLNEVLRSSNPHDPCTSSEEHLVLIFGGGNRSFVAHTSHGLSEVFGLYWSLLPPLFHYIQSWNIIQQKVLITLWHSYKDHMERPKFIRALFLKTGVYCPSIIITSWFFFLDYKLAEVRCHMTDYYHKLGNLGWSESSGKYFKLKV